MKKHRRLPHNMRKYLAYKRMYRAMRYGDEMPEMYCLSLNEAHRRTVKAAENERMKRNHLEDWVNNPMNHGVYVNEL